MPVLIFFLFYRQHLRSEDHIKLRSKRFGDATQTMKILKSRPFLGQRKKYSLLKKTKIRLHTKTIKNTIKSVYKVND